MNIRLTFTIAMAKLAIKLCRLTKHGGTDFPGRLALRLYPQIIDILPARFESIVVTGTNGKTTTTKMIGQILSENGIAFITNKSGANLRGGLITTFIENVSLTGKCEAKTALLEIDEAAFRQLHGHVKPKVAVVTNFFRDQLDRYGELYTTLSRVKEGISKYPQSTCVLNADDSLCASIAKDTGAQSVYYGFAPGAAPNVPVAHSDAVHCFYCKMPYNYTYHVYGHLGDFSCPQCGYKKPDTQTTCTQVKALKGNRSEVTVAIGEKEYSASINLPGLYNVYNALAAITCADVLGLPVENSLAALSKVESGFGRMESIPVGDKTVKLVLVKNPTGFNQVITHLLGDCLEQMDNLSILINDNVADSEDVSWLWDVDFEPFADTELRINTSGRRANDMAVRLKYAGVDPARIHVIPDQNQLIDEGLDATQPGHDYYILTTYTAMFEIREKLGQKFTLKEFWA